MQIEIDTNSGFCFGVVNAINKAEAALGEGQLSTTGDIVHNPAEVERLEKLGLRRVESLDDLQKGDRLLIRAHGEPPETYRVAREKGIALVDATCPVVSQLQRRVAEAAERMAAVGGQVVILGKRGHAEVVGLTGNALGRAIVIEGKEDLGLIDFEKPLVLISQTTQSVGLFNRIADIISERAHSGVEVYDTICRQVADREEHLVQFARRFDVVLFVSGRSSSNGKVLFGVVRGANPNSHFIENETELKREWFEGAQSVGICGATSTPQWLMTNVKCKMQNLK